MVVSTSSKLVKPVAGTVHIESDRIIGCGSVDLGRMPQSVAAKGDFTQASIEAIIKALTNLGTKLATVTSPATASAAGAAGSALMTEVAFINKDAKQIKCKDVRVS